MTGRNGPRTSLTHPLRIDVVEVPGAAGLVGMTLCPGRRDVLSGEGEWARDLELDLDAVALWKPDAVLALLEPHEFTAYGIPTYADSVRARGLMLEMLPIRDGGIPGAAFEAKWHTVGPAMRELLRNGGRVLVHCRAGLGRTGTVAARLLVEHGVEPDEAIARVRKARPNTIELDLQEPYVRNLRPVSHDRVGQDSAIRDRALGCFIGLAVGDALGTTLEFTRRDSQPPLTDIVGGGPFRLKPGEWTDDTSMAICLAESLIAFPELNETDLMERFVRLRRSRRELRQRSIL